MSLMIDSNNDQARFISIYSNLYTHTLPNYTDYKCATCSFPLLHTHISQTTPPTHLTQHTKNKNNSITTTITPDNYYYDSITTPNYHPIITQLSPDYTVFFKKSRQTDVPKIPLKTQPPANLKTPVTRRNVDEIENKIYIRILQVKYTLKKGETNREIDV